MPRKPAATAPSEELDFSKSQQRLKPETFFRFIREYPNQQATQIYIYRLQPVIDRGLAGIKTSYINTLTGEASGTVDEDFLLRTHGSGKYMLTFNDGNRARGQIEVAKCNVDVWDPTVDPVLNPVELVVNNPGNDQWIQRYLAKGYTVAEGKLVPPAANDGGAGKLAETVKELAGQVAARPAQSDAQAEIMRRALDVITTPRESNLREVIEVANLLRPPTDPVQVKLLEVVANIAASNRPAPVETQANPLSQMKETIGFLKEIGWGSGGGGGGASWMEVVAALPGIFQYGAQMLGQLVAMRAVQGKVVPITSGQAAPGASFSVADNPASDQEADFTTEVAGMLGMMGLKIGPGDVKALIEVGQDAVDAFSRGIEGNDFAHGLFCRRGGERIYGQLAALGKDTLMMAIEMAVKNAPEVAQLFETRKAELEGWIDGFLSYGAAEDTAA